MSKPSARGWSAKHLNINTNANNRRIVSDSPRSSWPFFTRIIFPSLFVICFGGSLTFLYYERITYMSWVKRKQQENGFASAWKKATTHHLTICSVPHFQTEVESGKSTGGTNTSRFSSSKSTGAVATREKRETIVKNVVVNFIVNYPVKLKLKKVVKCWEATAGQRKM